MGIIEGSPISKKFRIRVYELAFTFLDCCINSPKDLNSPLIFSKEFSIISLFKLKFVCANATLDVVNSATPPPLGLRKTNSPADVSSGSSYLENSQVAVIKIGIFILLFHCKISEIRKTLS